MNEMRRYYYLTTGGVPKGGNESHSKTEATEEMLASMFPSVFPEGTSELTPEQLRRSKEARGLSVPWWPEAGRWEHEDGDEQVAAPMLFTSQEAAEADLQDVQRRAADNYLDMVEMYGEATTNRALDNTAPPEVHGIDEDLLLGKLEDAEFLCVMVDGRMKLRREMVEELRGTTT